MKFRYIIALLALSACAVKPMTPDDYFATHQLPQPTLENFPHCHGYGCAIVTPVALSKKEWQSIKKIFKPKSKNAAQERERIAKAIGIFETKVGAITGTSEDIHGTFDKMGRLQHDCVDESTNTTVYLTLLDQKKLLKFHDVYSPTARLPFQTGRWPHQTAVITEKQSGMSYAVDSWFHDNGRPAEIVPLSQWKDGWKPDNI